MLHHKRKCSLSLHFNYQSSQGITGQRHPEQMYRSEYNQLCLLLERKSAYFHTRAGTTGRTMYNVGSSVSALVVNLKKLKRDVKHSVLENH